MNRPSRFLLGVSVVALVLPLVSFSLTGRIDGFVPKDAGSGTNLPLAISDEAAGGESRGQDAGSTLGDDSKRAGGSPVGIASEPSAKEPEKKKGKGNGADNGKRKAKGHHETTTTTNVSNGDATTTTTGNGATSPDTSTTTTTSGSSTPTLPAVGDTLTGSVCPCVVKGTTTLKGNVSLKGDLMVDGGTLVARGGTTVDGNGYQIMFMNGGSADFQGSPTSTWSGNGSNANLSRDLTFKNMRRIMWHMGGGKSTLKYFAVVDSGGTELGEYPLHWHLNGNSVRGTIVEGVVVVNGKRHAFVPHGSHGITFIGNIAKNTSGPAFWWDDPGTNDCTNQFRIGCTADNSNDIKVERLLVDGVRNTPGDDRGFRLAGVSLGAGTGNSIRNSVVRNVHPSHIKDCSAYHWPEGVTQPGGIGVWVFENNVGQSDCHGIFTWQNEGALHVISGFVGDGLSQGAYTTNYHYKNIDVPYVIVHSEGWKISNSNVGDVRAAPHVFAGTMTIENSTIDSFTVDDLGGPNHNGVKFILNGVNVRCSDIKWKNPHPDTKVVIDGNRCDR